MRRSAETTSTSDGAALGTETIRDTPIAQASDREDRGLASRRAFLKLTGIALGAAAMPEVLAGCSAGAGPSAEGAAKLIDGALTVDFVRDVIRPEDLLSLRLELINLTPAADGKTFVKARAGEKSFVVVTFGPQHIVEPATPWANGAPTEPEPALPIDVRSAGFSRLAFEAEGAPLPYALDALLASLSKLPMSLPPNTLPPLYEILPLHGPPTPSTDWGATLRDRHARSSAALSSEAMDGPQPSRSKMGGLTIASFPFAPLAPPAAHETAIELPYRMILAPHLGSGWKHAAQPYTPAGASRVELWTTRLGVRTDSDGVDDRAYGFNAVRAVWSPDLTAPSDPFVHQALRSDQRAQIVRQSADFLSYPDPSGKPKPMPPVHVKRMMLTSLGAYFDGFAKFDEYGPIPPAFIQSWAHETTMGRDQCVRVVQKGYLSLGHSASIVTVTERRFSEPKSPGGSRVAYLYQRTFLVVDQPWFFYAFAERPPWLGRVWPMKTVQITTTTTPDLDPPSDPTAPFWPFVGGKPFRFECIGVDLEDNLVRFDVSAVFIPADFPRGDVMMSTVHDGTFAGERLSKTKMRTQRVAMAESAAPGSTAVDVASMTLGLVFYDDLPAGLPKLFPFIEEADVSIPAVRRLTGVTETKAFAYPKDYIAAGFDDKTLNPAEIFLVVKEAGDAIQAAFGKQSDKTGGFLSPSMAVKGLSRIVGPIGGSLNELHLPSAGQVDPAAYFAGIEKALIFGAIPLSSILGPGALASAAPKFVTDVHDEIEAFFAIAERYTTQGPQLVDWLEAFVRDAAARAVQHEIDVVNAEAQKIKAASDALGASLAVVLADFQGGEDGLLRLAGGDLRDVRDKAFALAELLHLTPLAQFAQKGSEAVLRIVEKTARDVSAYLAEIDAFLATAREVLQTAERAKNLTVRVEWRPDIVGTTDKLFTPIGTGSDKILLLAAEMRAKQVGSKKAGVDLLCSIDNFQINLFGDDPVVSLQFTKVQFKMDAGKKPDVDVVFKGIKFGRELSFVNTLQSMIPFDGFSDPPSLTVDASGIRAGFSMGIPNLAIGILSLENISLGAFFKIPFIGEPLSVGFNFCTRENPFRLTVSLLGGGGFFGIALGMNGIQLIEAALEFGAAVSLNLVVASGSVSIMAGIYFRKSGDDIALSGYVRIRGQMDVLGIISLSVEMRLELGYKSGNAYGIAEISLEISIAFFSKSVSVTCEKTFCGSNGDPTFAEVMAPDAFSVPWDDYCLAFA